MEQYPEDNFKKRLHNHIYLIKKQISYMLDRLIDQFEILGILFESMLPIKKTHFSFLGLVL